MPAILQYTMDSILTDVVVLERDFAEPDEFAAEQPQDWQPLSEPKCRLWWWKGSKTTARSASQQYARPQATYDLTGGDLALPLGTDVTTEDRVGRVTDAEGERVEEGPFRILSVNRYETHVELSLERP
jgi:hypothetical protein